MDNVKSDNISQIAYNELQREFDNEKTTLQNEINEVKLKLYKSKIRYELYRNRTESSTNKEYYNRLANFEYNLVQSYNIIYQSLVDKYLIKINYMNAELEELEKIKVDDRFNEHLIIE